VSPAAINLGRGRAHLQRRSWRNSTARASWAWLGLRLQLREVIGEAAWCLRGGGGTLGMRATDSVVKADHATDLRDPELGYEVSGRRGARGWLVGLERAHWERSGATEQRGSTAEAEQRRPAQGRRRKRENGGADRWG
jgi:hypothetical protein